jgi:hypothetical protein
MITGVIVIPAGFEPTTRSLEGCCSIQLSYETILWQRLLYQGCKSTLILHKSRQQGIKKGGLPRLYVL